MYLVVYFYYRSISVYIVFASDIYYYYYISISVYIVFVSDIYYLFIYLFIYHYLPPFELPTLSQKLAITSLSNFLGILRTSVRSSDRNFSGIYAALLAWRPIS